MKPHAARDALAARDLWQARRRRFDDDDEGIAATEATLERVIELAGSTDLACHLVFEVERDYWQSRNTAARVQKARQDRLGLGWANHDHHTFRCSRRFFPRVIGDVHPAGLRAPRAVPRRRPRRLGCADPRASGHRHRHLRRPRPGARRGDRGLRPPGRCRTCRGRAPSASGSPCTASRSSKPACTTWKPSSTSTALRDGLKAEAGIETMAPFSNFPFLRQAFTAGERWPVSRHRADRALELGWIDAEQHEKFLRDGTIGSHLENLERREGYKGFNQQAVSAIIAATDPAASLRRWPDSRRPRAGIIEGT